jgi:alkanesulfonate monooxygenase SsuD/methylene tetrahydromethanopterin reductase-like flavin-dependent oxidoreductase (luciferase family)
VVRIGVKPHQLGAGLPELRNAWREAEDAGFESVWLFDHVNRVAGQTTIEALALLSALATETRRARVGVLVLNASLRHPALVAAQAAALDQISGGRLELGVGAGSRFGMTDAAAFGLETPRLSERVARLDEYCRVLSLLWSGEAVSFGGRFFRLDGAQLGIEPVQAELPLIVGGGRRMLGLAAREAVEWNRSTADVEEYRALAAALGEAEREVGRTVRRSVQVNLSQVPDGDVESAVERFAEAGAERVVFILDPPFKSVRSRPSAAA